MTLEQVQWMLREGGAVVDIGQLSAEARKMLRQETAKGTVERFTSYRFPAPKTAYRLAHREAAR